MAFIYYTTIYYNDSVNTLTQYNTYSNSYWGFVSRIYGGYYFYSYNVNFSAQITGSSNSGYVSMFGYTYNYTVVLYNWSLNIYLAGATSY